MAFIGKLPGNISLLDALDSIGENIIVADLNYNIAWMNSNAVELFSHIGPLFKISEVKELLGMNMSQFHHNPNYQQKIMDELIKVHRARINIRDSFVADIVITPIKCDSGNIQGYIVMLLDVTTKAEEEKKKENLLKELSVPILHIWEKTIALPLLGEFNENRGDDMISCVLKECTSYDIEYVLIDFSGVHNFDDGIDQKVQELRDCLQLIGTECILVGITPKLAMAFGEVNKNMHTFSTSHAGLRYIIGS